jgi:hypothetical protein
MKPDSPDRPHRPASGARGEDPRSLPAESEPEAGPDDCPGALPFEVDAQQRLWLKAVIPLLQLRSGEADPSGRVQFALDRMYVSACERIIRILHCDLDDERWPGC